MQVSPEQQPVQVSAQLACGAMHCPLTHSLLPVQVWQVAPFLPHEPLVVPGRQNCPERQPSQPATVGQSGHVQLEVQVITLPSLEHVLVCPSLQSPWPTQVPHPPHSPLL